MWYVPDVAVVASRVGLHPREVSFGEARRERVRSQQEFIGPVSILYASPRVVSFQKSQGRFEQEGIANVFVSETLVASPEDHRSPIPIGKRAVVHHGGRHAAYIFCRSQRFRAMQLSNRILETPILTRIHSQASRPGIDFARIQVPTMFIRFPSVKA